MLRIINNTSCGFLFLCKAHKSNLVFLCKSTKLKKGIDKPKNMGYNKANNNEQQLTNPQTRRPARPKRGRKESIMIKDVESIAAALYDGGWRAADREQLITEYELDADEADAICKLLRIYEERQTDDDAIICKPKGGMQK
jgi:hypothetical protein